MSTIEQLKIPVEEMQTVFQSILIKHGFANEKATACAQVFTANSLDGIYTHGVNRFPRFVEYIQKGFVDKDAGPSLQHAFGGMQQWNGNLGPGILNALQATDTAMQLAQQFGIGCVALANTNHWMRGGTYGWRAAKAGYVFIGWSNTTGLMPAWGATDAKLGNNPMVIALPYNNEAIVLDMAMSQYSYGALENYAIQQQPLPVVGGFDVNGAMTNDPAAILKSKRPMPIGYWKGAGLSLLLDLLAAILSGGLAVHQINQQQAEQSLSQIFIAIDIAKLGNASSIAQATQNIIDDYKQSIAASDTDSITWPGERVLATRKLNEVQGIPVVKRIWEEITALQ